MAPATLKRRVAAVACVAAALIPLIVAAWLQGCGGCSAIGCMSGAAVSVPVADEIVLDGATITVCFNDACVVSDPLPAFVSSSWWSGFGIDLPDGSRVSGGLSAPDPSAPDVNRAVQVTWWFPVGTPLAAGDRYRVTVTSSSGAAIADIAETAIAYDKFQTCNYACDTARFR